MWNLWEMFRSVNCWLKLVAHLSLGQTMPYWKDSDMAKGVQLYVQLYGLWCMLHSMGNCTYAQRCAQQILFQGCQNSEWYEAQRLSLATSSRPMLCWFTIYICWGAESKSFSHQSIYLWCGFIADNYYMYLVSLDTIFVCVQSLVGQCGLLWVSVHSFAKIKIVHFVWLTVTVAMYEYFV